MDDAGEAAPGGVGAGRGARGAVPARALVAEPDAGPHHHVLAQHPGQLVREVDQALEGRTVGAQGAQRGRADLPSGGVAHAVGEGLLGHEVEVERALADPGTAADVDQAGGFEARPREGLRRGEQHGLPGPPSPFLLDHWPPPDSTGRDPPPRPGCCRHAPDQERRSHADGIYRNRMVGI